MKTYINDRIGVKIVRDENGIEIEGLECDCSGSGGSGGGAGSGGGT